MVRTKGARRARLSPRKSPRQERSRATVEAILEATTDILIRQGAGRLTTNRIAERAGVNIASLYQYFPGKEAIVAELRRRHGADQRTALRQVLAGTRPGSSTPRFARSCRSAWRDTRTRLDCTGCSPRRCPRSDIETSPRSTRRYSRRCDGFFGRRTSTFTTWISRYG